MRLANPALHGSSIARSALVLCAAALPSTALVAQSAHAVAPTASAVFEVPAWAFPSLAPSTAPAAPLDSVMPLHVPHSKAAFTQKQTRDLFSVVDWHPERHPEMTSIIAHGRRPSVIACGYCHLPDGSGRPENAMLAGLPEQYFIQQVADIRSRARHSASLVPFRPSEGMRVIADSITDAEVAEAARYFSHIKAHQRSRVVESANAPRTVGNVGLYARAPEGGVEPLNGRMIELVDDLTRHELRDPEALYIAYVPRGSIARGRSLAAGDARRGVKGCTSCHGPQLRGVGLVPPIAGRSPTYMLRQLIGFRTGARDTPAGAPMREVASSLSLDDMIAAAAYAGSLKP
jgi:cytochrome c553